ncbi:MAG TPA: amylo-alpha-1,6-glucosidase [Saprospiraceae bacterium]|nr:amylo-alpha-1,6-glucosidase [Saprospiraceae bacterium]
MIVLDNPDYESLSSKEWIVTNGIGGYASGTLSGANTRRYHGLLVASYNPPTDRRVIISNIEETIISGDVRFPISTNQYPGTIHPDGYKHLKLFERSPFPKWTFSFRDRSVVKSIFMIYGTNTTVVEYENTGSNSLQLQLIPFLVFRDYHSLRHESDGFDFMITHEDSERIKVLPGNVTDPLFIFFKNGKFKNNTDWYRGFEYAVEKERGLDDNEDAKSIGQFTFELKPGDKSFFIISTDERLPEGQPSSWKIYEELRLKDLKTPVQNNFIRDLIISGDQFLVWRLSSRSHTLIAGYHWFTDWGRDTMIAMRGLIIATGQKQVAESIFLTFIHYLEEGLIPNRFPDTGKEPEYNTIDASLWLFIALYEYYQKFEDQNFITRVVPSLAEIIDSHYRGTKSKIEVTKEGLLSGGEKNTQLTWMDAKVDDHVVTPRHGCAVEINALWYNALQIFIKFNELLGNEVLDLKTKASETKASFRKYFINDKGYLNDVVIPGEFIDDAIRCNQIYAASLPFSPISNEECKNVLKIVEEHLYTDLGLRSLSPHHPDFKPVYTGDQWNRDHAYHQGTVWTYLWGEYALAYLKVHNNSPEAKQTIRAKAKRLEHHFYYENGIHSISEIFDGGNPRDGKGCIQQAWSVGMTIRALLEAQD